MRSTDSQRPPPPPTTHAQRNTALPLQRSRNARVHRAAGHTLTSNQLQAQSHAAATAKRGAAMHTRQHKAAIAILRHSTLLATLTTAPAMNTQRRAFHVARLTQPRFFTVSQVQCTPYAHAN